MRSKQLPTRLISDHYMNPASSFGIFRHEVDGVVDTHWHQFFELGLVVEGTGVHDINGSTRPLRPGHIFLLTPADFHKVSPEPGGLIVLYDLVFEGELLDDSLLELMYARGVQAAEVEEAAEFEEMLALCRRLQREAAAPREDSRYIVKGGVERLLVDLLRLGERSDAAFAAAGDSPLSAPVRKALALIQYRFREPIALGQIAAAVGLSANYFSECFSGQTGMTFQHYVKELRLSFARSLLLSTALPVTDVCYASGFSTLSYFEKAFKLRWGSAPRELRGRRAALAAPKTPQ